jgi:hypothetical protein
MPAEEDEVGGQVTRRRVVAEPGAVGTGRAGAARVPDAGAAVGARAVGRVPATGVGLGPVRPLEGDMDEDTVQLLDGAIAGDRGHGEDGGAARRHLEADEVRQLEGAARKRVLEVEGELLGCQGEGLDRGRR